MERMFNLNSLRFSDTTTEMGKLERTLDELPSVVWDVIVAKFNHPQQELLKLCRASSKLEKVFTQGETQNRSKLRLIGEMVFGILAENCYLTKKDFLNCGTASEELGYFVGTVWRFLEMGNKYSKIILENEDSIRDFIDTLRKRKQNIWNEFIGKAFVLEQTSQQKPTTASNKAFWEYAKQFLTKYGKYIVSLKIVDFTTDNGKLEVLSLQNNLLQKFQNLQNFKFTTRKIQNQFGIEINSMTREKQYLFRANPLCFQKNNFVSVFSSKSTSVLMNVLNIRTNHKNEFTFEHINKLTINNTGVYYEDDQILNDWVAPKLTNVQKLSIGNFGRTCSFKFAALLANLTELKIGSFFSSEALSLSQVCLPGIKTLSLMLFFTGPCRLNQIVTAFPSLARLNLIWESAVDGLIQNINSRINQVDFEQGIDIFQFYATGRNLADSNIWEKMNSLFVLCFVTSVQKQGECVTNKVTERYIRHDDAISCQKFITAAPCGNPWLYEEYLPMDY